MLHYGRLPTWLLVVIGLVIVAAGLGTGRPALWIAGLIVLAAAALRVVVGRA